MVLFFLFKFSHLYLLNFWVLFLYMAKELPLEHTEEVWLEEGGEKYSVASACGWWVPLPSQTNAR